MDSFSFLGHAIDLQGGEAAFRFALQKNKEKYEFKEKLLFPGVTTKVPEALLKAMLDNLMLILGISYWKLYCPKVIKLPTVTLTKEQASFWNTVYTKGLGEFFYKNNIDFRGLVQFPYKESLEAASVHFPRQKRSLLPFGGGKDSIVVAEILKKDSKQFDLLSVNTSVVQQEVAAVIGKKPIIIERQLDPKLFELNKQKDMYNGHIPISAMYAFVSLFAAALYDYNSIVLANEKSANYGNVEYLGEVVNHQWSKSEEFEKLFQAYVNDYITPDIHYFSILRPFSELEVTKEFVKHKQYFSSFSSCNRNFTITRKATSKWCGTCPKCAFVFAMLSAYLPKKEIIGVFGKNLFADLSLLPLYKELLGIENFKPFECVGTPEETKEAFSLASKRGEFNDDPVAQFFLKYYEA